MAGCMEYLFKLKRVCGFIEECELYSSDSYTCNKDAGRYCGRFRAKVKK